MERTTGLPLRSDRTAWISAGRRLPSFRHEIGCEYQLPFAEEFPDDTRQALLLLREDIHEGEVPEFGPGVSQHPARRVVHVDERARAVSCNTMDENGIAGILEKQAIFFRALQGFFFCQFYCSDIQD